MCQLLEDEIALLDEGSVSAHTCRFRRRNDSPAGVNGATRANQVKLQGFDLELSDDQTQWKHLMYYDTTTATKRDMGDLYDANVSTVEAVSLHSQH